MQKAQKLSSQKKIFSIFRWDGEGYTKYFSKIYDTYTTISGWRKNLAKHALKDLAPGKMLDVGCGTGYLMSMAQKKGFDVIGVDPSSGMLEKAKEKFGYDDMQLVQSTSDNLPFESETFDVIVASGSLEHVSDLTSTVKEMKRVLKPNGIIRIVDHSKPIDKSFKNVFTPFAGIMVNSLEYILHNYEEIFKDEFKMTQRKPVGRGGYMQLFDFIKK